MNSAVHAQPHYPGLELILNSVADWITRYRQAQATRNELSRCSPEEVARMAHELGVSAQELAMLAGKSDDASALLGKMLRALGVDPSRFEKENLLVMHDLQRLCVACGEKQRCAHELDVGSAAKNFREYCPNAYTLEALLADKTATRPFTSRDRDHG